ncbi:uncharacterized protein K452DRAFT_103974 [Aplosporella prunicola CBS 121167]|uniref:Uncharacterized protein n=1 Tax=Aplosporella prunicola CBS 121167 TaxID=1176127 RepID=A0A6A6BQD4_9PEZI|nr:uncharacterized protein K452DRAFT_103974 [Aplosporella prunicola CBS 121167]KAF2145958.1 hypothetical protein K452DRAFT_103974 [Aplosporella prunicola CBS 121167]
MLQAPSLPITKPHSFPSYCPYTEFTRTQSTTLSPMTRKITKTKTQRQQKQQQKQQHTRPTRLVPYPGQAVATDFSTWGPESRDRLRSRPGGRRTTAKRGHRTRRCAIWPA